MQSLVSRLSITDAIIVSLILKSTTPVAFFQASRIFALIVRYSETFLRVLYPKLIRDSKNEDITLTLRLQSVIGIPLAVGAFSMAEPLLGILGEQYVAAVNIMRILVILAIVEGIEYFMWNILAGTDKVDEKIEELNFKKLKHSWLVKLPIMDLTKSMAYFAILITIMYLFGDIVDDITLGEYWAITALSTTTVLTVYKYVLARKAIYFEIPSLSIIKYSFAGIIMAGFLYVYQELIPLTGTSVGSIISYIIPPGFISVLIYGIIVLSIDSFIRESTIDFIKEIRS